jgi:hypothetical protein
MKKEKLIKIIQNHHKWLTNNQGERADLSDADLRGAYLSDADLRGAVLSDADLRGAYLRGAYLSDADLRGAYLSDADLRGAYLRGAYLSRAVLRGADLRGAYLRGADLSDADLRGAVLSDADLRGADLRGAYLSDAEKSKIVSYNQNCPEDGDFIAWKKVNGGFILKLLIIGNRVSSIAGRKCRTNKVKVLEAFDCDGNQTDKKEFTSRRDGKFIYRIGETSEEKEYDPDFTIECSRGIHFFITKREAMDC